MARIRRTSSKVTGEMAAKIKFLCDQGYMQHDVAAKFGINQGRVSEIVTGKKFSEVLADAKPPEISEPELPF